MADNTAYQDLLKDTSESKEDGNYFLVTITDLNPATVYPLEFRWTYKDKKVNDNWSSVYLLPTPNPTDPTRPKFEQTDLSYFQGILTVTWSGKDNNNLDYGTILDRIDVYVASDASPGVFTVRGNIKTVGGKLDIPVEPGTYYVKLKAIDKVKNESIFSTNTYSITCKADSPLAPSSVSAAWTGADFTVSWTHDPSNSSNKYLGTYRVTLTSGSDTKTFDVAPVSGSSQSFTLTNSQNRAIFVTPKTSFSGSVTSIDNYGNSSSSSSFSSVAYVSPLSAPVISATAIVQGYSVSYTTPTSSAYDHIEIEEVESSNMSDPGTGYSVCFSGLANPATIIRPNTNKRWVRAKFVDKNSVSTTYSTAVSVTPTNPVTVDTTGPDNVSSVTTSGGIDTSGYLGFNAYADISWPAVTGNGIRGYRIRFSNDGGTTYSYVDSPGTGTTYRLGGLAIGSTYKIAVATYDEYNNLSSSFISGADVTVTGTPSVSNYITGGPFQFGVGVGGVSTNKGLYFDASNYWYINASNSARLKVGGSTSNYLEWDGGTFTIDGNLIAQQGTFKGNVQIASGGSLYSGTYGQGSGNAGYILNTSGLRFDYGSTQGITQINASTGKLTTASANIGGWDVDSNTISKTQGSGGSSRTVVIDSSNANIRAVGNTTSYTVALAAPSTNSASDIVLYAGSSTPASAPFRVRADGGVTMTSATITGYATQSSLDSTNSTVAGKVSASDVVNHIGGLNTTTISGGVITTGIIKSTNHSGSTDGSAFTSAGTAINVANGTISTPKFRINTSGSAFFTGTVVAEAFSLSNTGGDYWSITPGSTSSGFRFGGSNGISYSGSGNVTIGTNTVISGDLSFDGNNYWKKSNNTFRVGDGTSYIDWSGTTLTVKGDITANAIASGTSLTGATGSIGGWTINTNDITSSSGGTVLYNNGKITIGVTGDDSLTLNYGANLAMFAASGNASIINFYTSTSPTLADARIQQTAGGDLQIRGWYGGTYRTALAAYTYIMQGALAQSYFNGSTTATLIVRRDNPSSSDLSTDIATTTRMIQFQKSYADGGTYTGVGGINASNTTTNPGFYAGSDERLKKNIEVFNDTTIIKDIKKINTYKFHDLSVSDDSRKTIGFMAKEFYPKYPDIVIGKPDEIDEDGNPVYMQIMRENLIPHLFNAIKYLAGKVEELEERINNV